MYARHRAWAIIIIIQSGRGKSTLFDCALVGVYFTTHHDLTLCLAILLVPSLLLLLDDGKRSSLTISTIRRIELPWPL
jgi:hypothetical protein